METTLTDRGARSTSRRPRWQMMVALIWRNAPTVRARFYFRECLTTEITIARIVSFQQGYSTAPDEVEVWPPIPIANSSLSN